MQAPSNSTVTADGDYDPAEHYVGDRESEDLGPYSDDNWEDDDYDDSDDKVFGEYHL